MITDSILFSDSVIIDLQNSTPELILQFFVLATRLGDLPTYIIILTLFYWMINREKGIALLAIGLTVAVVSSGLKETFGLPRPPESPHMVDAGHYGFPSGHALGSLVIYSSLLYAAPKIKKNYKIAAAFIIAATVSLSRIFIGVHYPGDVLGGIVFGLILLGLFLAYAEMDVDKTFFIGLAISAPLFLMHFHLEDMLFAAGGLTAVILGWRFHTERSSFNPRTIQGIAIGVVGMVIVFAGYIILSSFKGLVILPAAVALTFFVVVYPDIIAGIEDRTDILDKPS